MALALDLLDNIAWHTLAGPHAKYAAGTGAVRRYAAGFSPIVAFADPRQPDFVALAAICAAGEHLFAASWSGAAPAGWRIEVDATMCQMVLAAPEPVEDDCPEAVRLGPEHAAQALELAVMTRPGPFGARTIELGEYFGCFEGERLIAMAGERMQAGALHEISGVCTHPQFQGRGLARRLMAKVIRRQLQRGKTPFLHVMSANDSARRLYERMGFRVRAEPAIRVIAQT